jgi:probable HAF family extracellular repeat protein
MKPSKLFRIICLIAFTSSAYGGALYTATPLGSLGGGTTSGYAINASGQVTGESTTANGQTHAFVSTNGTMIDLGTLPGSSDSHGYGINNAGQVTGSSGEHAFLYSCGEMTDLAPGVGSGINNSGQVVGTTSGGAFLYSNGAIKIIAGLSGGSFASAINDSGQITGLTGQGSHVYGYPFLYSDGAVTRIPVPIWGEGHAINSIGQVTGDSVPGNAFLYSGGMITDIGTLPNQDSSVGYGINALSQIVGSTGSHAFIYSNGIMTDLNADLSNSIGVTLAIAEAINDSGQIVANGGGMAFLLTPVAVPEPSTFTLIGGIACLLFLRRKRQSA